MSMLAKAIAFASEKHVNQKDKGGNAYILHPLRMMMRLRTKDEELMCIAVLHDVVEDCNVTYEDLKSIGMTERVINAVRLLTKQSGMTYEQFIEQVCHNRDAMIVKREDLRDNSDLTRLKGVSEKDFIRMNKYMTAFDKLESLLNGKVRGYKAFNNDLTCFDYQFIEGESHVHEGEVVLGNNGFHFCTELQDVVKYYHQSNMRVFEIEACDTITDAVDRCSKRACSEIRLVKELTLDEVRDSITKPEPAYRWAKDIGDREQMCQYVTDSKYAYLWGRLIGDVDYMKQFITNSKYAEWWIYEIAAEDEQYFKDKGILV